VKKPDFLAALEPVVNALEKAKVPYYIGGSVASSAYGMPRATLDVDMVAWISPEVVPILVKMLSKDYYVDEEMILDAINRRSTFNIIHLETMLKIDIFVAGEEAYQRESLHRRRKEILDEESGKEFFFSSPEDIILNKLDWYRKGEGLSERQWNDVVGVMRVQRDALDLGYLKKWAYELGLSDLLEKALSDSSSGSKDG
jgi:hypothetical protein